jgi:hypothetical protein
VDAADFAVSGTTATVTGVATVSPSVYDLTVSGGDLANFNGTVGLNLAPAQNIQDAAGNALPAAEPGTDETYTLDNTAPTLTSFTRQTPTTNPTREDTLVFRATFNEGVQNVDATDFAVSGTTTASITNLLQISSSLYELTVSGGNLANFNGIVGLNLAAGQNIADLVGNALPAGEPATDETYTVDNTAPILTSFTRQTPTTSPTNADTLVFRATFNEDVQNVDLADFAVSGTTATVTNVSAVSASVYDVTVSGGNLAPLNGTVGLNLAGTQDIKDLAGNALPPGEPGTDETYLLDNTPPILTSFTRQTPATSPTNADTLVFRATFNEDVKNLDAADFAVSGTTASVSVAAVGGSASVYDVTVSGGDLANLNGTVGLNLAGAQNILDLGGNALPASEPATDQTYLVDNVVPTVTVNIVATSLSDSASSSNVTFEFSEDVTGFDASDLTPVGGTLSNFSKVNDHSFTATFTADDGMETTGSVTVGTGYTDPAGNTGTGNSDTVTIDRKNPTVTVDIVDASLTDGDSSSNVTFEFSENVTGFDAGDLTPVGGTLSNFAGSGKSYTATFTATDGLETTGSVTVGTGYTDLAGNTGAGGSDTVVIDTLNPTVTVNIVDTSLNDGDNSSNVTFEFSENVTGFDAGDLTPVGGTLSTFAGSGKSYSATFTASDGLETTGSVTVGTGYADLAGNTGAAGSDTVVIDTLNPTVTVNIVDASLSDGDSSSNVTFVFSEDVTGFDASDLTPVGGTLSNFNTVSAKNYTATFTATDGVATTGSVTVGTGYTDLAGNTGTGNSDTVTIDRQNPTVTVDIVDASLSDGDNSSSVTFEFSEDVTGFDASDLTPVGGTLSDFAGSGKSYTATFTATDGVATTGSVAVGTGYTDLAGNTGTAGSDTVVIDTLNPTVTVNIVDASLNDGDSSSNVTFEFSENVTGFDAGDLTPVGGTLSNFAGSGKSYTATFTATDGVATSGSVAVGTGYTDAAGNTGTGGSDTVVIDTLNPTVTVNIVASSLSKVANSSQVTFEFNEDVTGFDAADLTPVGGTLSNFTQVDGNSYTATFTATDGVTMTGSVTVGEGYTDVAGNTGTGNSDTVQINTLSVTVTVNIVDASLNDADNSSNVTFEFSDNVMGFDASDLTAVGGTLSDLAGSGKSYTATFTANDGVALTGSVTVGTGYTDTAGNPGTSGSDNVPIDTLNPAVTSFARQTPGASVTNADTLTFRVTFTEDVQNVDVGDFAVNAAPATTATVSGVTPVNARVYDVTVSGGDLAGFNGTVGLNLSGTPTIADLAGNALTGGEPATDETYTLDNQAPTVTVNIVDVLLSDADTSSVVTFEFSEDVTGFDASDLTPVGGTLSSFATVDGNSCTATFTATDGLETIGSVTVGTGYTDAAGNTGTGGSDNVVIDRLNPTLTSFTRRTPPDSTTNADTLLFRATFSEAVQQVDAADFAVAGTTTATVTDVSFVSAGVYDVTVSGGDLANFNGPVGLNLSGAQNITDLAGNTLPAGEPATDQGYTLDNTPATLTSFTRLTPAASLTNADTLVFRATFGQNVQNVDAADFVVHGTTASISVSQVSGSVYDLTLSGGNLTDLNGTVGLNVSNTQNILTDPAGNPLPTAEPPNDETYTVDNAPPGLTSFTRQTPSASSPTKEDALVFRATFTEEVQNVDAGDFTVNATPATTATVSGVSLVSAGVYDVTVSGGDLAWFNGTIGLNLTATPDITDLAGNALPAGEPGTDDTYTVDNTAPTLTSFTRQTPAANPTNADALVFRATFDEAVQNVDATDFAVNGTTSATVSGVAMVGGDARLYDVTVSGGNLANFNGLVGLDLAGTQNITDAAGNALPAGEPTTDDPYTLDNTAPTLTSFTRQTPAASLTNADTLVFRATFSKDVQNVDAADFAISGSTAGVTGVSPVSGSVYDVTVSGGNLATFNGTVGLNLAGAQNITDPVGNALPAGEPATDETYELDNQAPSVTVDIVDASLSDGDNSSNVTVEFSEDVTGFDASDLTPVGGSLSNFTKVDGNSYTATFTADDGVETTGSVTVGTGYTDAVGNAGTGHSDTVTIDRKNPTVTVDIVATSLSDSASSSNVTFEFSENVTGFDASDLTPVGGTLSNFATVDGNSYTATFTADDGVETPGSVAVGTGYTDLAGNTGSGNSDTVTIDRKNPTVTVNIVDASLNDGDNTSNVTFEFSENVTSFDASDLTPAGGTLSNFAGSGKSYTATFTATDGVETTGSVTVGTDYTDAAGNTGAGSSDTVTIDTLNPTVTVNIVDASLSDGDNSSNVTFEFSEDVTGFDASDLTPAGGTLSNFAAVDGNSYTATFTADDGVETAGSVTVGTGYTDAVGNAGTGNFDTVTIDRKNPTVTVDIVDASLSDVDSSSNVTFEFSEDVTGFDASDLTPVGGALSNFAGSGKSYTATFTADDGVETTGSVAVGTGYTDTVGNTGSGHSDTVTIDRKNPTVTVNIVDVSLKDADNSSTVTFEFSENVAGFDETDLTPTGGTLSNFAAVDGNSYTATFTADDGVETTGSVAVGTDYTDAAGNTGAGNSDTVTIDTLNPTVTVNIVDASLSDSDNSSNVTFEFSEDVTGFDAGDLTPDGGTLSNFTTVDGNSYTATFTADDGVQTTGSVAVGTDYTDLFGNTGTGHSDTVTIDRKNPTVTVDIVATSLNDPASSSTVTFEFSEDVKDFDAGDLTPVGGTLTDFAGSGKSYTAKFTATDGVETTGSVAVGTGYTDLAGNTGAGHSDTVTIDRKNPAATSFARQDPTSSLTNADVLVFRVTFDSAVTNVHEADFAVSGTTATATGVSTVSTSVYDVTVSGGDLASFTGTVGLNLAVAQDITDLSGNALLADEPAVDETYTLDNTPPKPLSFKRQNPTTAFTDADTLVFRATFDEAVTNVDTADFAVGGTTTPKTTATVTNVSYVDVGVYDVTVSGGDLADFSGVVGLDLAAAQNIQDLAGNALPAGEPAIDETYSMGAEWGDAPTKAQSGFAASYPTTAADDGAWHPWTGPRLGAQRDTEGDGLPHASALGDDQDAFDDEDGVTFLASLHSSAAHDTAASLLVDLQNAANAKLDAWIDFNRDGDWADAGERILSGQALTSGNNAISFTVPANAALGTTFARFRLSTAGVSLPTGGAADGEVEDYAVSITESPQGDATVTLPPGGGDVQVLVEGGNLIVRQGGIVLSSTPAGEVDTLTITGTAADEVLQIDASATFLDLALTFNGGGSSGDGIQVLNTPNPDGMGTRYVGDISGAANSGQVVINPGGSGVRMTIYFTGVAPSTLSGSGPLDVVVDVDASTAVVVRDTGTSNDGGNIVDANSPLFEDVTFSGYNTLNVYSGNGAETITLQTLDSASALTTINLSGDNVSGTDTGDDTFEIQAAPPGVTVNLTGGAGNDTFSLDVNVSGTIDGGSGSGDELDVSGLGTPQVVNLANRSATGLFGGAAGGFSNLEAFQGDGTNDSLVGPNAAQTWTLTGDNDGNIGGTLTFTDFANLTGGNSDDRFVIGVGSLSGNLAGGSGSDRLDYSTYGAAVDMDLDSGSAPGIGGSFSSIEDFTGSTFNDTLRVDAIDIARSLDGLGGTNNVLHVDSRGSTMADDGSTVAFTSPVRGSISYVNFQDLYLTGGALIITGTGIDNTLTITADDEDSGYYRLDSGPTVHFTEITAITFYGAGGNDRLIINNPPGGLFRPAGGIFYHGQNQTAAPGDRLQINGGSATVVEHVFLNEHDGFLQYDGTTVITYTGLEPVDESVTAVHKIFTFMGVDATVTLSDDGTANDGVSRIDSNLGEVTTFTNPSNSVTVNLDVGDDILDVQGLDGRVPGPVALNVNLGTGMDQVTVTPLATTAVFVDGGDPVGLGDVLNLRPSETPRFVPGAEADAGEFQFATQSAVSFKHIETLTVDLGVGAGGAATIQGTGDDDQLTAQGSAANTVAVQVNAGAIVTYSQVTALTLQGLHGDDDFDLDLNVDALGVTFQIEGGLPVAGSDTLTVTGADGTDDQATWTPSGSDAGALAIAGQSAINVTGIESLIYDGESDNEDLTFSGAGDFWHVPGTAPAAGRMDLTSGATLYLGIAYEDLGLEGSVTASGTGAADSLAALGTDTADDLAVAFYNPDAIDIALFSNYGQHVHVRSDAVESYYLDSAQGGFDEIFLTTPVNATGAFEVYGGGPADALYLTADGTVTAVTVRPQADTLVWGEIEGFGTPTIGFGSISALSYTGNAADMLTVEAGLGDHAVRVDNGPSAGVDRVTTDSLPELQFGNVDTFRVQQTTTTAGSLQVTFVTSNLEGAGAYETDLEPESALVIEGRDGLADDYTVAAPAAGSVAVTDTVSGAVVTDVATAGAVGRLVVQGLGGADTVTVTPLAATAVFVDGGDPVGQGDVLNVRPGAAPTFVPGPEADAGEFSFTALASVSFDQIEEVTVDLGVGAGGAATIQGTGDDDQLTAEGTAAQTVDVQVNAGPIVTYTQATALTLQGLNGDDEFDVDVNVAQLATLRIEGGPPVAAPGDALTLDLAGATGTTLTLDVTTPRSGTFDAGATDIIYTDLENIDVENGTYALNAITGTAGDDAFTLVRRGDDVSVRLGGVEIYQAALADLTGGLTINGSTGDDNLTVDFTGGNPIPAGGLTFNGQGQTLRDSLTIAGGDFSTITKTFTNANSGSVNLDGSVITYTGLEPVLINVGTVDHLVFNLPAVANVATLGDAAAAGQSQISEATPNFETTTFTNPAESLTVNASNSGDTINLNALDAGFSADLTINGGTGTDAINFNARTGTGSYAFHGGTGTDTLTGTNTGHVWNVTAGDAGNLDGAGLHDFTGIENLTGGTGHDAFVIGSGGSLGGAITGGGGTGTDTLQQTDGTNAWAINTAGAGTLTDLTGGFSGIENLVGGSGVDAFTFADAGSITGALNGGAGNDTLTGDSDGNAFGITGTNSGTLTGKTSGFVNVENLSGGAGADTFTYTSAGSLSGAMDGAGGNDTLVGDDDGNAFTVHAANAGVLADKLSGFTSIESLTGGAGADLFTIVAGGSLAGAVDGNGGGDTLNLAAGGSNATLTAVGTTDGFAGTAGGVTGGFDDINTLSGDGTLTGLNAASTWGLDGTPTYVSTNTLNFSGFTTLQGGSDTDAFHLTEETSANLRGGDGADTFTLSNAIRLTGSIDGEGASDTLSFAAYTTSVAVTLTAPGTSGFAGQQADVTSGFNNIDVLTGGLAGDALTGDDATSVWALGATQTYTSGGQTVTFSAFETLQGNSGADTFNVTAATTANLLGGAGADTFALTANLTGAIDGEAGIDVLNLSGFGTARAVTLTAAVTSGFAGTEAGVSGGFANVDTISAPAAAGDSLTGANLATAWDVDAGTLAAGGQALTFTNFDTLTGGTAVDAFDVSANATANLNGGAGDDTFTVANGITLTGSVNGQAGSDSLSVLTALTNATVSGSDAEGFNGTITGVTAVFDGIDTLAGVAGNTGTLTGRDVASTWGLDGTPTYNDGAYTLNFSNFATLQGGAAADTFNMTAASTFNLNGGAGSDVFDMDAALTGSVTGGAGADTLRGDLIDNVVLTASDGTGFTGTEASMTGGFTGIDTLTGNNGTVQGDDVASTWTLNAAPTYNDGTNTLNFSGFRTLNGGSANDTFNVSAADFAAAVTINGNGHTSGDTLNFNAQGLAVTATFNQLSAGSTVVTFGTIENVAIANSLTTLTINGTGLDDVLTVTETATNVTYQLTSNGVADAAVSVPAGTAIIFNAGDGSDELIVNYGGAGGFFTNPITYNGGPGTSDRLTFSAANVTAAAHDLANAHDGTVTVTSGGASAVVAYTGLEPITDNLVAADRSFTFHGGQEAVTLTDTGGADGMMTIDSTAGESVNFANPAASLTIATGSEDDTLNIASVDAAYRAALTIDGNHGTDTVTLGAALTLGAGAVTGNLTVTGETIHLNANVTTTAGTAAGSVALNGDIVLGANVTINTEGAANDGNVTFDGPVNGAFGLTVDAGAAGDVTITGVVGGLTPLTALTVVESDNTTLVGAVTSGAQAYTSDNGFSTRGTYQTTAANITFTAANDAADVTWCWRRAASWSTGTSRRRGATR